MMILRPVALEHVHLTWPLVKHYIEDGLTIGEVGEKFLTIDHMLAKVTSGQTLLCVFVDEDNKIHGALTMAFYNEPLHRVALVSSLGGKLVCNASTLAQIRAVAKMNGATILQAYGRPSIVRMLRKFDIKPTYTTVEQLL
jgi:hypothetical protein